MSYQPTFKSGDYKADCDVCGRTFKASQLRKRWDGLMTCTSDWEIRHPQDFVRAKADLQAPKWTRPETSDSFVSINLTCFVNENLSITERDTKLFIKSLGQQRGVNSEINGSALNSMVLNGNDTDLIGLLDQALITENYHIANVFPFVESVSGGESFGITIMSLTAINGTTLNSITLG